MSSETGTCHSDGFFKTFILPECFYDRPNRKQRISQRYPQMPPDPHCWAEALTSSSAFIDFSVIRSWKRSKLFVPKACSSSSLHRATSWGRSKCSRANWSSKSLEKRTISLVLGLWPVWTWAMGQRAIKRCFLFYINLLVDYLREMAKQLETLCIVWVHWELKKKKV